jgi:hypothetical protein
VLGDYRNPRNPGYQETARIYSGLLAWHGDTPRPPITDAFTVIDSTAADQDDWAWQSLLEGRPASGRRDTQLAY